MLFLSFFDGMDVLNRYLIRNAVQCPGHGDPVNITQYRNKLFGIPEAIL